MALSFTLAPTPYPQPAGKRKVLVTGAEGNIGSYFAEHSHQKYTLRLMVQEMDEDAEKIKSFGEVVQGAWVHDMSGIQDVSAQGTSLDAWSRNTIAEARKKPS